MSYSDIERRVVMARRSILTRLIILASLLCTSLPTLAKTIRFDIRAQPLPASLLTFAHQANMQLLYEYKAIANVQGNQVRGNFDKHVALSMLLRGTGLEATYSTADVAMIKVATGDHSQTAEIGPDRDKKSIYYNSPVLEEVTVTSRKRIERMQDVPVPVTTVSAVTLADRGQFRMQDYHLRLPGLTLTPNQFNGAPSIAIRGITSGDVTNPTVAITVDDVPFGSSTSIGGGYYAPDFDPSNLERVEVLRGPQGTLYGAVGIGGLIKFVTVDPSTEGFEGRVQAGLNSVEGSDENSYNMSAGLNIPLTDTFAVRMTGFNRRDAGYIDNIRGTGEQNVNQSRGAGGYVSAMWFPSDEFSLKLNALVQDSEILGSPYVTMAPGVGDLQQDFLPSTGSVERRFESYGATAQYFADAVELTSVTGYSESQLNDLLDYTVLFGKFTQLLSGTDDTLEADATTTYKFSQELRGLFPLGERMDLLLGAYYSRESSPFKLEIIAASPQGQRLDTLLTSDFYSTFSEWAAFSTLTYYFTDQFDLQIGLRKSKIKQTFGETDTGPLVPVVLGTDTPRELPEDVAREQETTYLVTPRYKISQNVMLYARYASGYRPGGINQGDFDDSPTRFAPDETQNYEIGIKGSIFDNRFSFDSSLYYIDWQDLQLSLVNPANGQNYFTNGSRARSEGVELSMRLVPTDGLHIDTWVVWNNAELTEAMPSPAQGGVNGPKGARLPFGSRLSASTSVEYEFALAGTTATAGTTVSYVGDRLGTFVSDGPERQQFSSYTVIDLQGSVRKNGWAVNLYINNLADTRGVLGGGNGTIIPTAFQVIQPRTLGLSVARHF